MPLNSAHLSAVSRGGLMFKRLVQKLQGLRTEPVGYDPSLLDDPVAMQTDWTPAKGDGASFRTHKLVEVNSFRLEFRAARDLRYSL